MARRFYLTVLQVEGLQWKKKTLPNLYAEVKLGNVTHRTRVVEKSISPSWNGEEFFFWVEGDTDNLTIKIKRRSSWRNPCIAYVQVMVTDYLINRSHIECFSLAYPGKKRALPIGLIAVHFKRFDKPLDNAVSLHTSRTTSRDSSSSCPETTGLDRGEIPTQKRRSLPSGIFLNGVQLSVLRPISGGGFADVYRGVYIGKAVALKVLRLHIFPEKEKVQLEFIREAVVWQSLRHPNVLPLLGICQNSFAPQIALVSRWMEQGDIPKYLIKNPSADRSKLVLGVARGLEYLHRLEPKIVHGDLRADNVLVNEFHEPRISDFGLARVIYKHTSAATSLGGKGAVRWQAPEILNPTEFGLESSKVTVETDVYAFACVCIEIFSGERPFSELSDGAVISAVVMHDDRPRHPGQPAIERGLSDDVWDLMQRCWRRQPSKRPDMSSVVSDLKGYQPWWRLMRKCILWTDKVGYETSVLTRKPSHSYSTAGGILLRLFEKYHKQGYDIPVSVLLSSYQY